MKISIISPVYNKALFLKPHIESILNQTYKNIELILINDGSTDNSLDILYKYQKQDKRIVIIDQSNTGQSIARYNGWEKATGDLIYFVDADDTLYNKNVISKIIDIFLKNEKIDCIIGQMVNEYDRKAINDLVLYNNIKSGINNIQNLYAINMRLSMASRIMRKSTIKKDFFKNINQLEDVYFSLLYFANISTFYYYKSPIYVVNRKSNNLSITTRRNIDVMNQKYKTLKMMLNDKKIEMLKDVIKITYCKYYLNDLKGIYRYNNIDLAKQNLVQYYNPSIIKSEYAHILGDDYYKIFKYQIIYKKKLFIYYHLFIQKTKQFIKRLVK